MENSKELNEGHSKDLTLKVKSLNLKQIINDINKQHLNKKTPCIETIFKKTQKDSCQTYHN